MCDAKCTDVEASEFDQWIEEYRKGKPYWSNARVEICRDTWMERAKRDAAPELLEALEQAARIMSIMQKGLDDLIGYAGGTGGFGQYKSDIEEAISVIAKATGASNV